MHQGGAEHKVGHKLRKCKEFFNSWNRNSFGNVNNLLKEKRKIFEDMQALIPSTNNIQSAHHIKDEINKLLKREQIM